MDNFNTQLIEPILRKHDVEYAGVFGSRARGDNRPDSDLDLLVKFSSPKSLFGLIGLEHSLSDKLAIKVDIVTEAALHPYLKPYILKDLRVFYGKR